VSDNQGRSLKERPKAVCRLCNVVSTGKDRFGFKAPYYPKPFFPLFSYKIISCFSLKVKRKFKRNIVNCIGVTQQLYYININMNKEGAVLTPRRKKIDEKI
jgi:hypothetical protein